MEDNEFQDFQEEDNEEEFEDSENGQLERNDAEEDNEEHEFDDDWIMCYDYIMWLLVLLFSCLCNNIMILLWRKFLLCCVFLIAICSFHL